MADEFPSVTLPFLQLGFDVDFVPTDHDGEVSIGDMGKRRLARHRDTGDQLRAVSLGIPPQPDGTRTLLP